DNDDPEAEFKKYLRQVSDDDEPAEPVSLSLVFDIRTWEIVPTEFSLGEIHVITRADGTVKRFSTLRELMHWVGRADLMVLYESKKLKSSHSTEQSAELQDTTYVSASATIAAGDPISAVPSVSAASSIPAETPIPAG
nr:hypothetical protein [Tanacetum cinerariifolium]